MPIFSNNDWGVFMIQIDDAGSGSLIGGTCIGVYDSENGLFDFEVIPLELYDGINFKSKKYLDYAVEIIQNIFNRFGVDNSKPIEVCRGYMFDKLRLWLTKNSFNWSSTQITGALQAKVEKTFEDYTISLGFPESFIKYTKFPFHFHKILRWVYADYENRSKLCKTGWKSWQKYSNLPIEIEIDFIKDRIPYHCLKCGKIINPNRRAKVLKYTSNAPNIIYLHKNC